MVKEEIFNSEKVVESFDRLSSESFKEKKEKLQKWHKNKLLKLRQSFLNKIKKLDDKKEIKALKLKYRDDKKKQVNQYALRYNHLQNQLLYRLTMFNQKKHQLKKDYKVDVKRNPSKKNELKKTLNKRIKSLHKKYSTPLSLHYLNSRTNRKNLKESVDLSKIFVPIDSPTKKIAKSILLLIITAIVTTFALDIFVKPFGLYSAGLRGITQTIFYVIKHYKNDISTSISHVIFFAANIPLAIFGYFKLGKKTTLLTIFFIVIQYLTSLSFELAHIVDYISPFGVPTSDIESIVGTSIHSAQDFYKFAIPFISAIIGAIIYGAGLAITYKAGASSGGSKFVVSYIAAKRDKGIGSIAFIFSLVVMGFGMLINHIWLNEENVISSFTSTILFSSIIYAFVSNITLDKVYPRSKRSEITLLTNKKDEIVAFLELYLLQGTLFTVAPTKVGTGGVPRQKVSFVVMKNEVHILTNVFSQIDKNSITIVNTIEKSYGKIYNKWFE